MEGGWRWDVMISGLRSLEWFFALIVMEAAGMRKEKFPVGDVRDLGWRLVVNVNVQPSGIRGEKVFSLNSPPGS
jgi:hypothetical protein